MGKKTGSREVVLRMDADLHRRVMEAANERELSFNRLACSLLDEGLGRLIPVDEVLLTRG